MNCKEFEKNIPEFIAGKLDFLTLQEFGEHMQECPGCKEELVIQFLVSEWQTRQTQNLLVATPYGFKSHCRQ